MTSQPEGLGLVLIAALSACGHADAQSASAPDRASGLVAPKGWQALPVVAAAVRLAVPAPGVTIDGIEAWGEPAMGCYGVWLALRGSGGTPEALAEQVLAGIAAEQIVTTDVVLPATDGVLALKLSRPPYVGRLRARLEDGQITALACVSNQREPVACEMACATLLGALPGAPS